MIFVFLTLAALGVGGAALRSLDNPRWTFLERLLYAFGLGSGICAYTVMFLGLAGALSWAGVGLACVVIAGLSAWGWNWLWHKTAADATPPKLDRSLAGLLPYAFLAMATLACALIACAVPPNAHEWDALSYHLAAPRQWILQHRITELPTDHHSYFPFLAQMLYTVCLLGNDVFSAKLVHWFFGAATCLATYAFCRRWMSAQASMLALATVAATPFFVWEAGAAYIELAQAFFVVMSFHSLLQYRRFRQGAEALLTGAFCGLSLAVKTLSIIPVGCVITLFILAVPKARHALACVLCALVLGSPFYVRSYLLTDNPVYPFAYSVFGGRYWDAKRAEVYAGEQRSYGLDGRPVSVGDDLLPMRKAYLPPSISDRLRNALLAPFALIATPRLFHNYNDPGPLFTLGFLAVVLLPLAALAPPVETEQRLLLCVVVYWLAVWSLTMQYARYLIPLVPLLSAGGAAAIETLSIKHRWLRRLAAGTLVVQGLVVLSVAAPLAVMQLGAVRDPERYLERNINIYASCQWLNQHAGSADGVVLFEETRGFYILRRVLWGNSPHSTYIPYERFETPIDMVRWFRKHGIRYALVNLQFAPQAGTQEGARRLRLAVAEGRVPLLFLEWYRESRRFGERWRPLLGQAVEQGCAIIEEDALRNGVIVLRFEGGGKDE